MKQPWLAIFAILVLIGLTSVGDVRGYPIRNYPDPDQCTIYERAASEYRQSREPPVGHTSAPRSWISTGIPFPIVWLK